MNKSDLPRRINASSSHGLTGVSITTLCLAEIIMSREKNTCATQSDANNTELETMVRGPMSGYITS